MRWGKRSKPQEVVVEVGDTVRIVGHKYFLGGERLPIGSEFVVENVVPFHNAIEYKIDERFDKTWWILPIDYEVIEKANQ